MENKKTIEIEQVSIGKELIKLGKMLVGTTRTSKEIQDIQTLISNIHYRLDNRARWPR